MPPPLWAIELSAWRMSDHGDDDHDEQQNNDNDAKQKSKKQSFTKSIPSTTKTNTKTKKRTWWFQRSKRNHHLHITATEESNFENDDDDDDHVYDYNTIHANHNPMISDDLDDRVILRVLPNGRLPKDDNHDVKSAHSFEDIDSIVEMEESKNTTTKIKIMDEIIPPNDSLIISSSKFQNGDELKVRSSKKKKHGIDKNDATTTTTTIIAPINSSDDGVTTPEKERPTYIQASQPSQAPMQLKIIKQSSLPVDQVIKATSSPSPKKKSSSPSKQQKSSSPKQQKMDPNDILQDLEKDEPKITKQTDRFRTGIRALTTKLRMDTIRRSKRNHNNHYCLIDEDNMSAGTSNYSLTPPIEVKINENDMKQSNDLKFDDDDDLDNHDKPQDFEMYDHKNSMYQQFHHAISSGVRCANKSDKNDEEKEEERSGCRRRRRRKQSDDDTESERSFGDPEPIYYDSEDSRSEVSLNNVLGQPPPAPPSQQGSRRRSRSDDNSTLSSGSKMSNHSSSSSRGSRGRRSQQQHLSSSSHHRRRPVSPVPSIRSATSLLDTSIIEETDADIMAETNEHEVPPPMPYSMKRTLSAPEVRTVAPYMSLDPNNKNNPRGRNFLRRATEANTVIGTPNPPSPKKRHHRSKMADNASAPMIEQHEPLLKANDTLSSDDETDADNVKKPSASPAKTNIFRRVVSIGSSKHDSEPEDILDTSHSFENLWNSPNRDTLRVSKSHEQDIPKKDTTEEKSEEICIVKTNTSGSGQYEHEEPTLPPIITRQSPRKSPPPTRSSPRVSCFDLKPAPKKPTEESWNSWKEQREFGGGIHARTPTVGSDESSSHHNDNKSGSRRLRSPSLDGGGGGTPPSNRAERARFARMKRLTINRDENNSMSDMSDSIQSQNNLHNERSARLARIGRLRKQIRSVSRSVSPATPTRGNRKKVSSVSSAPYYRMDDEPYHDSEVVDALDLQLIEVRRPLGAEYGPDEESL